MEKYNSKIFKIIFTGGLQALIQIANLLCGIAIIRFVSVKEYAYYTIANTILGIMTLLSDGGISSSVMAQSGTHWKDKNAVARILNTGLYLRKKFAIFSLIIAIPILIFLLNKQKASFFEILLITLSLIPAFYASISDSLLEIMPKLQQDIKRLQYNQLLVALLRFFSSISLVFALPFTWLAMLCNGIPRLYGNVVLHRLNNSYGIKDSEVDKTAQKEILNVVKRILPSAIFYTLSGQITIWIISIIGSQTSLAQIGALGRLSMILNVFSILISIVAIPEFAKLSSSKKPLLKFYLIVNLLLMSVLCLVILLTYFFPDIALSFLGNTYKGLNFELFLSIVGSCIGLMANTSFSLFISRGWVIKPLVLIPLNVLLIIVGIILFRVNTLRGALLLNLFTSLGSFLINNIFFFYKVYVLDESQDHDSISTNE